MLKGTVSVVTGGAAGLGRATVERLVADGGCVVAVDLQGERLKRLAETLGDDVLPVVGNVTDAECMRQAVADAKRTWASKWRGLHAVVHCAGAAVTHQTYNFHKDRPHALHDFKHIVHERAMGTYNVMQTCVSEMSVGGNVIMCVGHWLEEGDAGQVGLAAGDGAASGLAQAVAQHRKDVRVCTVCVGVFDTPLVQYMPPRVLQYLSKQAPLPSRLGAPHEFATLVRRLITSHNLSGRTIRLDGALRMAPL